MATGRLQRELLLAGIAVLAQGCVPLAWFVPPAKVEVSDGVRTNIDPAPAPAVVQTTPGPPVAAKRATLPRAGANDFRFAAGVHLANFALSPRLDVGLGYVLTDVGLGDRVINGVYGEAGPVVYRGENGSRLLFTARGEGLFADRGYTGTGYALYGRLSAELYGQTEAWSVEKPEAFTEDPPGFIPDAAGGGPSGILALGTFVELGEQKLPGGERAIVIAGGISGRVPASGGFICCYPIVQ